MWGGGPFGLGRFRERFFEKGGLKFVILALLAEKPMHGYEVIRALEEKYGGFYSPSPGAVYPILQMLEDLGYVTSLQQDGKRVYQTTEEGRAHLADSKEKVAGIHGRMKMRFGPWIDEEEMKGFGEEMREFAHDMRDFGKMFARSQGGAWHDPVRRQKLRDVLKRTRQEIEEILKTG